MQFTCDERTGEADNVILWSVGTTDALDTPCSLAPALLSFVDAVIHGPLVRAEPAMWACAQSVGSHSLIRSLRRAQVEHHYTQLMCSFADVYGDLHCACSCAEAVKLAGRVHVHVDGAAARDLLTSGGGSNSRTRTRSRTVSPSKTSLLSRSTSSSPSPSWQSLTPSPTALQTPTPSASQSAPASPTPSPSVSMSPAPTGSLSAAASPSPSPSADGTPSVTSSGTATSTVTGTTAPSTSVTPATSALTASAAGSMSVGTIAGVVIGSFVGVVAVVALTRCLFITAANYKGRWFPCARGSKRKRVEFPEIRSGSGTSPRRGERKLDKKGKAATDDSDQGAETQSSVLTSSASGSDTVAGGASPASSSPSRSRHPHSGRRSQSPYAGATRSRSRLGGRHRDSRRSTGTVRHPREADPSSSDTPNLIPAAVNMATFDTLTQQLRVLFKSAKKSGVEVAPGMWMGQDGTAPVAVQQGAIARGDGRSFSADPEAGEGGTQAPTATPPHRPIPPNLRRIRNPFKPSPRAGTPQSLRPLTPASSVPPAAPVDDAALVLVEAELAVQRAKLEALEARLHFGALLPETVLPLRDLQEDARPTTPWTHQQDDDESGVIRVPVPIPMRWGRRRKVVKRRGRMGRQLTLDKDAMAAVFRAMQTVPTPSLRPHTVPWGGAYGEHIHGGLQHFY